MAAALRKEPGIQVELIDGGPGELTVEVDGRVVSKKGDQMPEINQVLAAVRQAQPASAGR